MDNLDKPLTNAARRSRWITPASVVSLSRQPSSPRPSNVTDSWKWTLSKLSTAKLSKWSATPATPVRATPGGVWGPAEVPSKHASRCGGHTWGGYACECTPGTGRLGGS
jgi:hypothetical protein